MQGKKFGRALRKYKTFGLDTACFIYHLEGHSFYSQLTKELFSHLEINGLSSFTSIITVGEIFANRKIQQDWLLRNRLKQQLLSFPSLSIEPVLWPIAEHAAALRVRYALSLIDAIHLATSQLAGTEVFITNDRHFKKVEKPVILLLDDFK